MKILLYCEASPAIGLGHLQRMLAVREGLHELGVAREDVTLAVSPGARSLLGNDAGPVLISDGRARDEFVAHCLVKTAAAAVAFDVPGGVAGAEASRWRRLARVVAIDARVPGADLVIMPHCHFEPGPGDEDILHGPRFTILGKHARRYQQAARAPAAGLVAVTTGGSDPAGVLLRILSLASATPPGHDVALYPGEAFVHRAKLPAAEALPPRVRIAPFRFEALLEAELVVSTFGITPYELMALGVPTLITSHTRDNARAAAALARRFPEISDLGFFEELTEARWREGIRRGARAIPEGPRAEMRAGYRNVAAEILRAGRR